MNAERLHVVAQALRSDLQSTNAEATLQALVQALQNQINQPQQPQFQQQVSKNLTTLLEALSGAPSNEFSPAWRQMVDEMGGADLFGNALKDRLEGIFERNQITPSVALQETQEVHKQVHQFRQALDQLIAAFDHFAIGAEKLEPGQCELGVLVPRAFVGNRLDKFGKELRELNQIFATFAELVTKGRPGLEIRSISSTDLSIFVDLAPEIGACVAIAVERLVTLYKQLLEIRKLRQELKNQGVSAKGLSGVDKHAEEHMENGIAELVEELINKVDEKMDGGRRNELEIDLRFSLRKVANRIDRGFNIEIRAEPVPDEEEAEQEDEERTKSRRYVEAIRASSKILKFMKREGEPILSLPERKSEKEDKSGEHHKKR